jgi:hypothetical protein
VCFGVRDERCASAVRSRCGYGGGGRLLQLPAEAVYGKSRYSFFSVVVLASTLWGGMSPELLATAVSSFAAPTFSSLRQLSDRGAGSDPGSANVRPRRNDHQLPGPLHPEQPHARACFNLPPLALAAVPVAGAMMLKLVLFPTLGRRLPFTFFYSTVVATAWVGF